MKKILILVCAIAMILSMVACSGDNTDQTYVPDVIKNFDELEPSKFHGGLSGDGYFLVMYEGAIDEAVMGAVLTAPNGTSVTLSEETIVKNPDGNSLLWFEQFSVKAGDVVALTLEKEGYEKISFDVTVE